MLYSKFMCCNCDFSQFWFGLGEVSNAVEARIWRYYAFSKYLSVWGRVLLNYDLKTKHRSRLIPKDDMRLLISTTFPRIADIALRKQAQKSRWVTDWLKLFVIFQQKKKLIMAAYSFFQRFCSLIQWYVGIKLILEFKQSQRTILFEEELIMPIS